MKTSSFFNAHHSPIGAFASFTLGYKGAKGGLGLELSGPANQNVFIGIQSEERSQFRLLPFYGEAENFRERFDCSDTEIKNQQQIIPFEDFQIQRYFHVATDTWVAGDLTLKLFSPVLPIPDPASSSHEACKDALIPAVFAEITVDNRTISTPRKAIFGFQGNDPCSAMRRIDETSRGSIVGIGQGRHSAICTGDTDIVSGLAFSIEELAFPQRESNRTFGLGTIGALVMTAAPGEKRTWRFVICFYRSGIVTTGVDASYYYTRYFDCIEEVAEYAYSRFDQYRDAALHSDTLIEDSSLNPERKFMLSHAIRSYYGNTELLSTSDGPLWIVNEGEYRMMNTFDLLIDHLFFELKMNPWTVRNVLDFFVKRYSYFDTVRYPGTDKQRPGGISFTHDMGVANSFSRQHYSAYELQGLHGCFSYMTSEQLVNWILCAAVYVTQTNDQSWLQNKKDTLVSCFESMLNRDHFDSSLRDGIMDLDTNRCDGGSEITTYDNVDSSLGQARRNTYLAVKCWAAYLCLQNLGDKLGIESMKQLASEQAEKCAATILFYLKEDGTIPALLEEGNESVIISVIEGLVYVWFLEPTLLNGGRYSLFINALRTHCETVLSTGVCRFGDGGWRLSSTSDNSWLSKIYLCQFVAEKILEVSQDEAADKAHTNWLLDSDNSYFAWSDQMNNGKVCGSRYYPRGVTAILWI